MKKAYAVINGTQVENLIESELAPESIEKLPGRFLVEIPLNHELGANYDYIDGKFVQQQPLNKRANSLSITDILQAMDPNTKRDLILQMITELQQPTVTLEEPASVGEVAPAVETPTTELQPPT